MKFWILGILFFVRIGYSNCSVSWQQNSVNIKLDKNQSYQKIVLNLKRSNTTDTCNNLSVKNELSFSSRNLVLKNKMIPFSIFLDPSGTQDFLLGSSSEQMIINFPVSQFSHSLELFLRVNDLLGNAFFESGKYIYSERIEVLNGEKVLDVIQINFNLEIPPEISLELLQKGSSLRVGESLKFNRIEKGSFVEFDVLMISNLGHSVSIQSENNGFLKHEGLGEKISYQYYVNQHLGGQLNSSPQSIYSNSEISSKQGDKVGLKFEINQNVDKLPAGEYLDVIRVNITSEM